MSRDFVQPTPAVTVTSVRGEHEVYITVEGEVDHTNVHHLRDHLDEAEAAPQDAVRVDLRMCTFIDSTVINLLLERCGADGGGTSIYVGPVSEQVAKAISVIGVKQLMDHSGRHR